MQAHHASIRSVGTAALAAILVALFGLAFGQEAAGEVTVNATEHEQFGQILTDAEGRTLYLFINEEAEAAEGDRVTSGLRSNVAACEGPCLENWPPVTAETAVAGEGIDPELLYVEEIDGRNQLVYNGWPLYYFARDEEPGQVAGQGLGDGNVWYVLNAEGNPVTDAPGAMDGDGAAGDDAETGDDMGDDMGDDDDGDDGAAN